MSKRTCYECDNFFKSSFCGYDACYRPLYARQHLRPQQY